MIGGCFLLTILFDCWLVCVACLRLVISHKIEFMEQDFPCLCSVFPIRPSDPLTRLQPSGLSYVIAVVIPQNKRYRPDYWEGEGEIAMQVFNWGHLLGAPVFSTINLPLTNGVHLAAFLPPRLTSICGLHKKVDRYLALWSGRQLLMLPLLLGEGRYDASASTPVWRRASYFPVESGSINLLDVDPFGCKLATN